MELYPVTDSACQIPLTGPKIYRKSGFYEAVPILLTKLHPHPVDLSSILPYLSFLIDPIIFMKSTDLSRRLITAFLLSAPLAQAADLTWDNDPAAPVQGGPGIWNTIDPNWTADDGVTRQAWTNAALPADTAIFSAGTGTVDVAGTLNLAGLRLTSTTPSTIGGVATSGYRFTGGTLAFGAAQGTVDTSAAGLTNHQINSALTGSAGITIASTGVATGQGRLIFNGLNTGLTGGITVTAGLAAFPRQSAAGNSVINLNGGGLFGCTDLAGPGTTVVTGINQILSNNMTLAASVANPLRVWGGRVLELNGVVSGPGGFNKTDSGSLLLSGANTFTGPVSVTLGPVLASSFNSVIGGTPSSSLGAPLTVEDGTISLISTGGQGNLTYIGTGETTDRVVRFSGGGGGIITQSGAGLLRFTSDMTGAAAGMGVFLTGGGEGSINGITNTTALLNFNKQGSGTWTVNGNLTLNGGNIRPQGGILTFSPTSSTTGDAIISGRSANGLLRFTTGSAVRTATANVNGILGGWATFDSNTWAVTNGTGNAVTGLPAANYITDTWAAGANTDVTAAGADPGVDPTTNSLRFNEPAAKVLSLSGNSTILTGGIMTTAAVGPNPITITGLSGSNLPASNIPGTTAGTTAGDLNFHVQNAGTTVSVNLPVTNALAPPPRTGTAGTTTVITGLPSTTDLVTGMSVTGSGVPANATIASINSATQITLSAASTVAGAPTLTFGRSNNGLAKAGPGTLILNGVNSYTGSTGVFEGKLQVNANSGAKIYNVSALGTVEIGYGTGASVYNYGVNVAGTGTGSTNGLYLKGGLSYTFQSGINVSGLPTTVRTWGDAGIATLAGWDTNGTHLSIPPSASGTVFDSNINFAPGSYGYVMNVSAGPNTGTGDLVLEGQLTGVPNANTTRYRKTGTGSVRLNGTSTLTMPLEIWLGSVILGGDARLGTGAPVQLGSGSGSGRLILNGSSQSLTNLTLAGTGTANAVIGSSATLSTLTVNYNGTAASSFGGLLGGPDALDNNLALVKAGTGTFSLTAANTFTGGTTITGGTLSLAHPAAVGTSGAITLAGGTLQFTPANTTDYSANGRLFLADGTVSSIDTNGLDLTFTGSLAGPAGGLGKSGNGSLTLTAAQTFAGGTRLSAGTLILDYATANTSKLSNTAELTLEGGVLRLSGGSHVEVVGSTLVTGNTTIERSSGTAVIDLGPVNRTGTATLNLASSGIARISIDNDATGKLPAWITVNGSPAANDGSGNIIVFSAFVDVARLGGKIPNNQSANIRIVNGGTTGPITPVTSGTTRIGSLLHEATTSPTSVSLAPSDVLLFPAEGSIILPPGSGSLAIQGGSLTAGGILDSPGGLAVNADTPLAVDSVITDNGSGLVSLAKDGAGDLSLSGINFFSGGTTLIKGRLIVNHPQALGTGPLTINGGGFDNTSGSPVTVTDVLPQTWNADFFFTGTGELSFDQGTVTLAGNRTVTVGDKLLSYGGAVTGAFGLTKAGAGTLQLRTGSWSGTTTVTAGTLEVLGRTADSPYVTNPGATLMLAYTTGGGYAATNLKINGSGVNATDGLYLKGGASYNASGTIELLTAPTTIRHYGDGPAFLGMFDINGTGINVTPAASGSEVDPNIQFISRGYGMSVTVAAGANTATGDLVFNGPLDVGSLGLYKRGAGSLTLKGTAAAGNTAVKLQAGSILTGADNVLGSNAELQLSAGTTLTLNGFNQAGGPLSGAGRIRNGSTTPVILTIRQTTDQNFTGPLGGPGPDDGNFSFEKTGPSSLTLSGSNNYSGNTILTEGSLVLTASFLADNADVILNTGTVLALNSATTDIIDELILDGLVQAPGVYGPVGSDAQFQRDYLTGTGTLTVTTGPGGGYSAWETANGIAGAGAAADNDADGIANGIEFVIGGTPSGPGADSNALLPTATLDGTYLNFVYRRTTASASGNPFVQYGNNLTGWTTASAGNPAATPVVILNEPAGFGPGVDRVTVRIPLALASPGTQFFARLKFVVP